MKTFRLGPLLSSKESGEERLSGIANGRSHGREDRANGIADVRDRPVPPGLRRSAALQPRTLPRLADRSLARPHDERVTPLMFMTGLLSFEQCSGGTTRKIPSQYHGNIRANVWASIHMKYSC